MHLQSRQNHRAQGQLQEAGIDPPKWGALLSRQGACSSHTTSSKCQKASDNRLPVRSSEKKRWVWKKCSLTPTLVPFLHQLPPKDSRCAWSRGWPNANPSGKWRETQAKSLRKVLAGSATVEWTLWPVGKWLISGEDHSVSLWIAYSLPAMSNHPPPSCQTDFKGLPKSGSARTGLGSEHLGWGGRQPGGLCWQEGGMLPDQGLSPQGQATCAQPHTPTSHGLRASPVSKFAGLLRFGPPLTDKQLWASPTGLNAQWQHLTEKQINKITP